MIRDIETVNFYLFNVPDSYFMTSYSTFVYAAVVANIVRLCAWDQEHLHEHLLPPRRLSPLPPAAICRDTPFQEARLKLPRRIATRSFRYI